VYWVLFAGYFLVILRSSCDGSVTLHFVFPAVARFASRRPCLRVSTSCVEFSSLVILFSIFHSTECVLLLVALINPVLVLVPFVVDAFLHQLVASYLCRRLFICRHVLSFYCVVL
jgi:hypothetical protein